MIYTSNYQSIKLNKDKALSISWDKGKDANYDGLCYPDLASKLSFWKIWKNNREILSEEENNRYYIEEYYKQVLSNLDPSDIYNELNNKILLCYEDNMDFCHRHIVSAWLELFLDMNISEVIEENGQLKEVNKPSYIKEVLEQVIRKNINMYDFKSIRGSYFI